MLIIPAATAHLLTDRMHRLLILSCGIGMVAALAGAFGSFLGARVPAGPVMVLAGAGFFALAFLFSPRHGWLMRLLRQTRRQQREERENTLKTMHRVLEDRHPQIQLEEGVSLRELSQRLGEAGAHIDARARDLIRSGLATLDATESELFFTPEGQKRARAVVRNHRLWELYLTPAAAFAPDHVHDQAEEIEHLLGEETVRQLSRRLDYPTRDPHGRPIPAMEDIHPEATDGAAPNPKPLGYQG
jgi:manganese/zinc/iron transport system permease protein